MILLPTVRGVLRTAAGVALTLAMAAPGAAEDAAPPPAAENPEGAPPPGGDPVAALFGAGMDALAAAEREGASEDEREARLDEAVAAFRAILIDRPELARVRLELARAFFLLREDDLSRRHFEQALAGGLPPAAAANVRRFLAAMRARRRWSAWFGAAIAPDSNLNRASDTEIVHIDTVFGNLPFRRNPESFSRSGVGFSVQAGGEYRYPLGDRLRLRAGADSARLEYKGDEFDRSSLAAHLGPLWPASETAAFSLLADARREWRAGKPLFDETGGRIEAEYAPVPRLSLGARAGWRWRDWRSGGALDGPVADLSLDAVWAATPVLRVGAGVGAGRDRPRTKEWRAATARARLSASVFLPLGFTVGARGEWLQTKYEGDGRAHFTRTGGARVDRTRTLSVSLLNRGLTFFGFSPQVAAVVEIGRSNAQARNYERRGAELRAVRQF